MSGADDQRAAEVLRRYLEDPNRCDHPTDEELAALLAGRDRLRDRRDYLQGQLDIIYDAEYSRNDTLTRRIEKMGTAGDALADAVARHVPLLRNELHDPARAWWSVRGDAPTQPPAEQGDDPVERLTATLAQRERELKAALTELHELKSAAPAVAPTEPPADERGHAIIRRLIDNLAERVDTETDPGTEALGALWEARQFVRAAPAVARTDGQPPADDLSWPVDGPDPINALRALPGAHPHIDIVEARLHALLPPALEAGCPDCGGDDCDDYDWAERARLEAAIVALFEEYGYREGGSLARLAAIAIEEATAPGGSRAASGVSVPQKPAESPADDTTHDIVGGAKSAPGNTELDDAIEQIVDDYIPDSLLRVQLAGRVLAEVTRRTGLGPYDRPVDDTTTPDGPVVGYVLGRRERHGTWTLWDDDVRESHREIQIAHAEHVDEVGTPPWRCYELRDVCAPSAGGSSPASTDGGDRG